MDRVAPFLLFFAALPPAWLAGEIIGSDGIIGAIHKRMEAARLHVTLLILGWFPRPPARFAALLDGIVNYTPPDAFRILFEERISRAERVLLKLAEPLRGVERYQRALRTALGRRGIYLPRDAARAPHMTLGYAGCEQGVRPRSPIGWRARELVLIYSEQGRHRYGIMGRWPLEAPGPAPPQLSATA